MESKRGILNYMNNQDIYTYTEFLKYHSAKDEFHKYQFLASTDDYSIYDGMQLKFDMDGEVKQSFIELKGRFVDIDKYNDCAVDTSKIKELQRLSYLSNIPTYIVAIYYNDSKLAIWKIDPDKEYQSEVMRCFYSQIDLNKNGYVNKDMVKLPMEEATICKIPKEITYTALTEY